MEDLRYNVTANYSDNGMSCVVKMAKIYYKITNKTENHNGFQYKDGLNVDTIPFAMTGSCVPGGLYFSDAEHVLEYINYGTWIREVTIPDKADMVEDPQGGKWRASGIILGERRDLRLPETWKWMKSVGIKNFPIEAIVSYGIPEIFDAVFENPDERVLYTGFQAAIELNQFNMIKHLVNLGAKSNPIAWAKVDGSINSLRLLISLGLDINSDYAHIRFVRSLSKHSKQTVKNMIRLGCKPNRMPNVLYKCVRLDDISLVKYMVKHGFDFKTIPEEDWVEELSHANPSMKAYLQTLRA